MYPEISEQERFPLLSSAGRSLLYRMRQHTHAPIWNWPNGEQLDAEGLSEVHRFANALKEPRCADAPDWLEEFTDFCLTDVPFYRSRSDNKRCRFQQLPSCSREDLAPRVWDFVPDSQSLDKLIVFSTSGTTGHPARMLSHPATAACGVPLMEHALSHMGISFPRGTDSVAITNVAAYRGAFTTAIVVSYLQESGCIRVNLHPTAWRHADDREKFINSWKSPVWLGDPIAFGQLRSLDIDYAPQAILSSIMRLPPGLAMQLQQQYGCPVLDLYAMTEVGILGVQTPSGHLILPHDVYVEILGPDDTPVPDGHRGEVTVTSRRNPFLPLLRYRTGDFAALRREGPQTWLIDLEGRTPVQFPLRSGRIVHSMEVTRLMRTHPILQYRLHQDANGNFSFGYRGMIDVRTLSEQLHELLEHPPVLHIEPIEETTVGVQKVVEYRSEV